MKIGNITKHEFIQDFMQRKRYCMMQFNCIINMGKHSANKESFKRGYNEGQITKRTHPSSIDYYADYAIQQIISTRIDDINENTFLYLGMLKALLE